VLVHLVNLVRKNHRRILSIREQGEVSLGVSEHQNRAIVEIATAKLDLGPLEVFLGIN